MTEISLSVLKKMVKYKINILCVYLKVRKEWDRWEA